MSMGVTAKNNHGNSSQQKELQTTKNPLCKVESTMCEFRRITYSFFRMANRLKVQDGVADGVDADRLGARFSSNDGCGKEFLKIDLWLILLEHRAMRR
jgi:hypothetical protein